MIESIRGKINTVTSEAVVVENNGIGYLVFCPNPFSFQPIGQELVVYTYQYVREDAINLYGFKTRDERALFQKLLNVSGIGPKGALAVLASGEPNRVIQAIEAEDEKFLTKFPGVGKKTARQMILDLKGKLGFVETLTEHEEPSPEPEQQSELDEAIAALQALGYSEREIKRVVPELQAKQLSAEQYIKTALKLMFNE